MVLGYLLGFILALLFAFARISKKHKIIKALVTLLIEVIRGTPLLVQLVYMYYVVPLLIQLVLSWFGINSQIEMTAMTAGVIGLGIHYGCYMSEVIRSAIESIDIGQTEAALALGFSEKQALFGVVVPQALKNSLPVFGNYLVMIVKDTSLLSYVALPEMLLITKTFALPLIHIYELRKAQVEADFHVNHDYLTGLSNRRYFHQFIKLDVYKRQCIYRICKWR